MDLHRSPATFRTRLGALRLVTLMERYPERPLMALFALVNSFVSVGVISATAVITHEPFVFPSAGATAFLLFFSPLAPGASPRNTVLGHLIGALCGLAFLVTFGLGDQGPALPYDVTWSHSFAAAASLGVTAALMVLFRAPHPPAGATAMVISLGLIAVWWEVVVLMLAILLLVGQAIVINRLAGLPYPLWAPNEEQIRTGSRGYGAEGEAEEATEFTTVHDS